MRWESASIRVPGKPLLTLAEVATAVGYSRKQVGRWIAEGKFPEGRAVAGGALRWSNMAVGVWLAWQEHGPRQGRGLAEGELSSEDPETAPVAKKNSGGKPGT